MRGVFSRIFWRQSVDRNPIRAPIMTTRLLPVAILACVLTTAAGCTGQQVYESGTAFRIQECQQIPDDARRAECMELARKSYKEYQDLKRGRER
jgi:hypothetical protein